MLRWRKIRYADDGQINIKDENQDERKEAGQIKNKHESFQFWSLWVNVSKIYHKCKHPSKPFESG